MRYVKLAVFLSVLGAVAGSSVLNWRAQLETQRKLDSLAAAIAQRPVEVAQSSPTTIGTPTPAPKLPTGNAGSHSDELENVKLDPAGSPLQTPTKKGGLERATTSPRQSAPVELDHVALPPYIIESPDLLTIEAIIKDPKANTTERLPTQPVSGAFLVRPDGTVGMGVWGSVSVTGLTVQQATKEIRQQLAKQTALKIPCSDAANKYLDVTVNVVGYNSKVYYIITDFGEKGEQVFRFSLTGDETVLDALSCSTTSLGEMVKSAKKLTVQLTRKGANGKPDQELPVDWVAIIRDGNVKTNYQVLPGDRIFVKNRQ